MGNKQCIECDCRVKYNILQDVNNLCRINLTDNCFYLFSNKKKYQNADIIYTLHELYGVKYNDYIYTIFIIFESESFFIEFYNKDNYDSVKMYIMKFINKIYCKNEIKVGILTNNDILSIQNIKKNINLNDFIYSSIEESEKDLLIIKKSNNQIKKIKLETIKEDEEMNFYQIKP